MVKTLALLTLLPAASGFMVAPKMTRGRTVKMNFGYEDGGLPVGGVKFFPDSQSYFDPLNLSEGASGEKIAKYQAAEIKHGRIAMLACLHYVVVGNLGIHLPGTLGGMDIASAPLGLAALKAVPAAGIAQILLFASALEVLAPQKDDKVPGNVQPDTDAFAVPGDVEIRTKEINNGRLAMISIAGLWAGEAASGGTNPFEAFASFVSPN